MRIPRIGYLVLLAGVLCVAWMGQGLCAVPVLTCDSAGIGAVAFTDENGNSVQITSVTPKTSGSVSYCEVKGVRWPLDPFIVALPDSWGGTYWQTGNGGAAGSLGSITNGISRGYVAASGSGGHDANVGGPEGHYDGATWVPDPTFRFAYPPGNAAADGKVLDYCTGSVHVTKLLVLDMIEAYYGKGVQPDRSYYNACSTGGRQGLIEAQRFPNDFDGLVIGAPVHYLSRITQRGVWERQALAIDPWTATGGTVLPKLPILAAKVMEKCDATDGLKDGLIDDPRTCNFNPLTDLPYCDKDVDGAACFTSKQRKAIKMVYDGPPGLSFSARYPSHAFGSEEMVPGTTAATSNWAGWIVPSPYTPTAVSRGFDLGAGWVQWVGLPLSGEGGPAWDWTTYSWTGGDPQQVVANTAPKCDATDPELWALRARGAKIIHYDGWPDPATGAFMTVKYYDDVLRHMGVEHTKSFYKLYMVPGMGHCGGGTGCGTVDWQTIVEDWVERGIEPEAIVGSRTERGNPADPDNYMTARTRPLCPYPEVARWDGTGSIDNAASFSCVPPVEVRIEPEVMNLKSRGEFTAFITIPHEYRMRDWQLGDVTCEGAEAKSVFAFGNVGIAKFHKRDLQGVNPGRSVTLTVKGAFHTDGKPALIQASDTVKVVK
jgi:feruloyl esterase